MALLDADGEVVVGAAAIELVALGGLAPGRRLARLAPTAGVLRVVAVRPPAVQAEESASA